MSEIERRKREHVDIVLSGSAGRSNTASGFDAVCFEHNALPELNLNDVDLSTTFVGRHVAAPILVSSMTGGPKQSEKLNLAIAEACETLGLGFGVGSQRIALETGRKGGLGRQLRRSAPRVPILANFGASQLGEWNGIDMAHRAVEMIEADALIVHLNPLQEAVQSGGTTDWRNVLSKIAELAKECAFPIIVKEVGAGISADVASRLAAAGVSAIDVAGAGGTSWAAVEAARAQTTQQRTVAEAFRDWGIPTARALIDVRNACPNMTLIASGGIRSGIDCAKAIRLGADMTGVAAGALPAAVKGPEAMKTYLEAIIEQLKIACFCTGSRDLDALRRAALIGIARTND